MLKLTVTAEKASTSIEIVTVAGIHPLFEVCCDVCQRKIPATSNIIFNAVQKLTAYKLINNLLQ